MDSGNIAFMLIATALVMIMTPAGLALFYGGLTQRKSVLNTSGMSYAAYCIATLAWFAFGYSFAFGESDTNLFGSFEHIFFRNIAPGDASGSIPVSLFATFQGAFAAIAVAIVSGSIIERVRFSTWLLFAPLWVCLCYAPLANWVWGGGFLAEFGELDFAGGTVVHINAGVAGLTLCLLLGARRDMKEEAYRPSSVKLALLGSALLWFGWFGFNAGSALAADASASYAFLVTNLAGASGALAWLVTEWITRNRRTLFGTASGVVAGLVGITPAAGFVDAGGAIAIGLASGVTGYFAVMVLKRWLGYDDALDAFGIHGAVGIVGSLLTGVFANPAISAGNAGLLYGNPGQVWIQLVAVVVTIVFSAVATAVCFQVASLLTRGGRISAEQEYQGMDIAYHGEGEN